MRLRIAIAMLRVLRRNRSGLAAVEFALSLPLLLIAGLYGTELANYALTTMKVSEVAMHVADNAARIGDTSTITNRAIFEADVTDLLSGSAVQGGSKLDFYAHGRTIISSLEIYDPAVSCFGAPCPGAGSLRLGQQFIHWQRCMGLKRVTSDYGNQYDLMPSGMGPAGEQVNTYAGTAVIFVEVTYDYQPLISARFFGTPTIKAISSFTQRDNVDLSGLKRLKRHAGEAVADCRNYTKTV